MPSSLPPRPPGDAATPAAAGRRLWSVRTYLVGLVLACLLPGMIGAIAAFVHEYREGRSQLERDRQLTVRALAQAVDNQILQVEALAHGLATAGSLAHGEFGAFHRQARQTLQRARLVASVVLIDRSGRQVLNTLKEFGEPLPMNGNPALIRQVFESGRPVVSDIYVGAVMRRPIMTVGVPVFVGDRAAYVLIAPILPDKFAALLAAQGLPPGWVATVLDGKGAIVARTGADSEVTGTAAAADLLERYRTDSEGSLQRMAPDGRPVLSLFARSRVTGWGVCIDIPPRDLDGNLREALSTLALGIAAVFLLALALAWLIGAKIARSFQALAAAGQTGGTVAVPARPADVEIKEAAEVAHALAGASQLLQTQQAALQASERSLQQLIATLPGMVWTATPAGEVDFIGERWYEYTGTQADWQLGNGWLQCLHPDDADKVFAAWRAAVDHRQEFHAEYRLRRHDGVHRWFKSRATPILDDAGNIVRWLGVATDIHDLKVSQKALAASRAELLEAQRLARMGTWFWDAESGVVVATEVLLRMFGWVFVPPFDELRGTVLSEEVWQRMKAANRECVRHGVAFQFEIPARRTDGRPIWIAVRGERVANPHGRLHSLRGTAQDITERRLTEERLLASKQEIKELNAELERRVEERTAELKAANRELEGFTFAASHDLRAPLGRINSFSRLLEQRYAGSLAGDGLMFLDQIRQNAGRLIQLVEDLLSHARVARQDFELQPVEVAALVAALVDEKADELREAGAVLRLDLPPGQAIAEPQALRQALINLIDNALKYSARATPPTLAIDGELADGFYRIRVRDNGIGFDMAYRDKIFEIFRRLHTYGEYPGTGVGLALVKRAMERMGGRVWAESASGRGATFHLELRAAAGSDSPASA